MSGPVAKGAKQSRESEAMVAVKVGDENLVDPPRLHLHQITPGLVLTQFFSVSFW